MNAKQKAELKKIAERTLKERIPPKPQTIPCLDNVAIELTVALGKIPLSIKDIMDLKAGDSIPLNKKQEDTLEIYAGGVLVAYGELIEQGENYSLVITKIIQREK